MRKLRRWSLGLLLLLMPILSISCIGKDKETFFVKIMCDRSQMVQGDSCLLSVVAYAAHPFILTEKPRELKVKHGHLRQLRIGRQPLQRVRERQRIFYACVVEQYVLRADEVGKIEISEQPYKAELHIQEGEVDPLDAFLGRQIPIRKVAAKGESEEFVMKVIEKPRRTMQEMRESGVEVI